MSKAIRIHIALCAGFSLGYLNFFLAPLLTPIYVSGYGIEQSLVGWVVGAEVTALTLSTVLLSRHIALANLFSLCLRGVLIFIFSNLAMLAADGFISTVILRALCGVGEGAVLVSVFAAGGNTTKPEKSFGLMSVAGGLFSAAGLLFVPEWLEMWGERSLFAMLAAVGIVVIPLLIGLSSSQSHQNHLTEDVSPDISLAFKSALFVGLFLLSLTGFGIWPFLDFQAVSLGLPGDLRASLYSFTTLMNMMGSVFPVVIGMRLGLRRPVVAGSLLCTACLVSIGAAQSQLLFVQGSALLLFSIAMILPYMMAFCSMRDQSGELVAKMPAVLGVGQAVGPVLAGALLPSGFATLGVVFGVLCFIATLLFAAILRKNPSSSAMYV